VREKCAIEMSKQWWKCHAETCCSDAWRLGCVSILMSLKRTLTRKSTFSLPTRPKDCRARLGGFAFSQFASIIPWLLSYLAWHSPGYFAACLCLFVNHASLIRINFVKHQSRPLNEVPMCTCACIVPSSGEADQYRPDGGNL
jgi:hypothetical protein